MEEVWTRNSVNMLIAPIKAWERVAVSFLYQRAKNDEQGDRTRARLEFDLESA